MKRTVTSGTRPSLSGNVPAPQRRRPRRRRGNIVVLTAFVMAVLLAFVAFAIDIGYIVCARTMLQRTADASALAAAKYLPNQGAAGIAAVAAVHANDSSIESVFDLSNIEFGFWDRDLATFTSPPPGGTNSNAIRVNLEKSVARGNPLSLFFGGMFGTPNAEVSASATAMYDRWLCGPFVGIEQLSVPGNPQTDSYDSAEGAYSPLSAGDRGSICSDGPISVEGNPVVRGDATAGNGYSVSVTGSAVVTGSTGTRIKRLNLPPVDASGAAATNDNAQIPLIPQGNSFVSPLDAAGNFTLDGNKSIVLPAGPYYFNDFTLSGQADFAVSGPTTIYITGDLRRAGGVTVTNLTQDPSSLVFMMTGGVAEITSTNDLYGVIYAPNTNITLAGDANLFGAVVGKTLLVTGSGTAHYDESLDLEGIEFPRRTALVD